MEKNTFFTGFIPHNEVLRYMKSFDIAISYHEDDSPIFNVAVPTKILEYLACGCSILATNHVMYQNLLSHKINSYLTDKDSLSFSQGIKYLLNDHNLRSELSQNAIISAMDYAFSKKVEKYMEIYLKN